MLAMLEALPEVLAPDEEVVVLHRPEDVPALEHRTENIRWRAVDIPAAPTWRRVLAERRRLRRLVDNLGVHVLELGTLPVPRRLPCAVSLTIHDVRDADGVGNRPKFLARTVIRRSLRHVDRLVTPSHFTKRRLEEITAGAIPPTRVIPNCASARLLATAPRWQGDRGGRSFFLHVGHLEARKNLLMLLSAFAGLLSERGAANAPSLCFVGRDHGMRDTLRERAAMLEITPHIHFLGGVDDHELRELYASCCAVVMPSFYEGFGFPALEGLAAGRPVLVSDRGALPEVVEDYGVVLQHDDAHAWTEAMTAAWHVRRESIETRATIDARKKFAARTSWLEAAQAQLDAWREAAASVL